MNHHNQFVLPCGNRTTKRKALISYFLEEKPGTGNGANASRYRYDVESYQYESNSYSIFLKRPTQLNKGFDFTVNIEGLYFKKKRKYSNPSHEDVFNALSDCKRSHPFEYEKVKKIIIEIYDCKDPNLNEINAFFSDYSGQSHPIQVIILAIKWLFMEQDCAYWNYSGRAMLFQNLKELGLV